MSKKEFTLVFMVRLFIISLSLVLAKYIGFLTDGLFLFFSGIVITELVSLIVVSMEDSNNSVEKQSDRIYGGSANEKEVSHKIGTDWFRGREQLQYGIIGETEEWDIWYEPINDDIDAIVIRDNVTGEIIMTFPEDPFEDLQLNMDMFV